MTKERNLHYKTFSQRLSEENINWLKEKKQGYGSWNLFFKELKKQYGNNNNRSNSLRSNKDI